MALVCLSGCMAACGQPLKNGQESPETLARAVLNAVARRDAAALRSLTFDEAEFREQVWPELPASRPERNLPFGYVWTDLRTKSNAGLSRMLEEHGGQSYELDKVTFTGGTTQYRSFLVHRDATLTARDRTGQSRTFRLFGSVIEKGGRFKVFSYVID